MSGGGSQTSTSVQQADPRIWNAVQQNMGRATSIADQPFQSYGGQFTADLTRNQNQAIGMAPGLFNAGSGAINSGILGAQGAQGFTPDMLTANTAQNPDAFANLSRWQNPFENQVVQGTLSDIERQRQMQQGADADSAISARAFGGSREGVQRALTNEAYDRNALNAVSGLRSQGFNTAAGLAQQDAARGLNSNQFNANAYNTANAANQNAGLQGNAQQIQVAGLLGQLGGQQQQMYGQGLTGLLQTGGLQQGTQQSDLDARFQEFLRQQQYPYQGQQLINQSLGLLPQGGTTTNTQPGPDRTGQVLGALGTAAMFMSDERTKADIETVGFDAKGRRWAKWRYHWEDPRIRHFGLIAQEALKTDPNAVMMGEDGFYRIDYSKLTRH
jgi:hypothetical protein